jgi:hypothetical protein
MVTGTGVAEGMFTHADIGTGQDPVMPGYVVDGHIQIVVIDGTEVDGDKSR